MQLRYTEEADFIVIEKPCGFRTHKVSDNQLGFVEVLSEKLKMELWVVHRLDKETSGLIVFAKSAEAAKNLSALFEKKAIQKTYFFLTNRKTNATEFKVESTIEKFQNTFRNAPGQTADAFTNLTFVEVNGSHSLWKAQPLTGKPHQIRLHAEQSQISILGDKEHSGSPWHRLALHAAELSFTYQNKKYHFTSELPKSFRQTTNPLQVLLEDNLQTLQKLYTLTPHSCYRLIHSCEDLKVDIYGDTLWVYWYNMDAPTAQELEILSNFSKANGLKYVLRHMINRGTGVGGKETKDLYFEEGVPETWTALENGLKFELRREAGFSPGLFLDQRENRKWVLENSKKKSVLNLFSYTSGFSVAAAVGGATLVTTVDASANFLDWSRENFRLNNIDPGTQEFFAQDTLLFLKGSIKRGRKWDLIICDPPVFGRTKTTTWKIEKDLPELIQSMWACLNKGGALLFTCNFEKWTLIDLQGVFQTALKGQKFSLSTLPAQGFDFDLPDGYQNLTKGLFILR